MFENEIWKTPFNAHKHCNHTVALLRLPLFNFVLKCCFKDSSDVLKFKFLTNTDRDCNGQLCVTKICNYLGLEQTVEGVSAEEIDPDRVEVWNFLLT